MGILEENDGSNGHAQGERHVFFHADFDKDIVSMILKGKLVVKFMVPVTPNL